jgi:predicted phosphodiesterase
MAVQSRISQWVRVVRLAVFSDIHGNPYACRAVLHAIDTEGVFDVTVAAGDLCYGGSDPAGCVDMLRQAGVQAVYGNTDEFIFAPQKLPPDEEHLRAWDTIQAVSLWAANRLGPDRVAWLAGLPFEVSFSPTSEPSDALLVVHANPKNVHDYIGPPFEEQIKLEGKIAQPDDDPGLASLLADVPSAVIAFGHLHYTSLRRWGNKLLVNVAPCSVSPYDGDHRARYTVFTWEGDEWKLERRYVEYNYTRAAEDLRASDMPYKEGQAKHLN